MGDTLDGFPDFFQNAVNSLMAACPGSSIGSGSRTHDEQAYLYQTKGAWSPTNAGAAAPGTSNHEVGVGYGAADMEGNLECLHAKAAQFGLHFPIPNEPWHIEPTDELIAQGDEALAAVAPPEDSLSAIRDMIFGKQGGDPADIPARVREGFAVEEAPAASTAVEFTPQASAGFDEGAQGTISATEAARYLAGAGFKGEALVTAVAVAMGESGLNTGAMGDTTITGGGWGPSIGLMQIRSRTSGDEANGWRDGSQLTDPTFNAKAAYAISNGGTNFGPWTVYSKGIYKQFVEEAKAAVAALGSDAYGSESAAPPAASTQPDAMDPAAAMDAIFDPAGSASAIAEMMLARTGDEGDIMDRVKSKDDEVPTVDLSL